MKVKNENCLTRARARKGTIWGNFVRAKGAPFVPSGSMGRFAKIDQFAEEGHALQQGPVAHDEHAFSCTRQRHVQFAVDPLSAFVFKLCAAQKGQLRGARHGETVDDGVALRTLETFDGVDGHFGQFGMRRLQEGIAHQSNLPAIGHDDAQIFDRIEAPTLCHEACIFLDGQLGDASGLRRVALGRVSEFQGVGHAIVERQARHADGLLLVGQGNGAELALVELSAGEVGHCGVHAPLAGEVVATFGGNAFDEAFEKRTSAVGQSQGAEFGFGDETFARRLLHHGGELTVVADEHETVDERTAVGVCHQEREQVRFEQL